MTSLNKQIKIDYQCLVENAPDLYLILSPEFNILDASNAYLAATLTKRENVAGRPLFEVFPDNPDDINADGVTNLRFSLNKVLSTRKPHKMEIQKYDIRNEHGVFEVRYWSPENNPVLDGDGKVRYIIHRAEDVTEQVMIRKANEAQLRQMQENEKMFRKVVEESENRFQIIFNASPIAIFITNAADGCLKYVNKAFEKLFGINNTDAIGRTLVELKLMGESDRSNLARHVHEVGGHNVQMEVEVHTLQEEVRKVLVSTEVIEMDNTTCFLKAMVDITDRKRMEDEIRQTNHFLDNVLENMPSIVSVRRADDLSLVRVSKAVEATLGLKREELIGKSYMELYPAERASAYIERDRNILASGTLQDFEELIPTNKGERWLHTRKIPVFEDGKPLYVLGISQDVTEKRNQRDSIIELNKELEAFSYSVAHDLRAPLRAITGFAKLLETDLRNTLDAESARQLGRISKNAEKMTTLIDDLLAFSKLGKQQLKMEKVNMNQLIDWALADISKAGVHKAEIVVKKLHPAKCDFMLMSQVMINLISNAIKYSSKKDEPVVTITSEIVGKEIIYSVADNGAGFDMRYSSKLFEVFQRLHRTDEFEGTGVGLAIVKRIINRHHGRVWAEAEPGKGATFYFSLPLN